MAADTVKKRILMIDDEVDFLRIAKLNLETTGRYEVRILPDACDIVAQVNSFRPDLILLDILMPTIDGVEVCTALKNDPLGKDVPVVALSALDTEADRERMYGVGVSDYLIKPVSKDGLIAGIDGILGRGGK